MRNFVESDYQIKFGEVVEVIYDDKEPSLIYGVKLKLFDLTPMTDETSVNVITAKPLNLNILRLPIVGEVVLCLRAPNSYSAGIRNTLDNYYIDIVGIQSSVHQNALPTVTALSASKQVAAGSSDSYIQAAAGNTLKTTMAVVDKNFSENPMFKPLQPYVGDVIFSGRYGQSLRFSTSQNIEDFSVLPKWSRGTDSAPITILRNTRMSRNTGKFNDFVTENFTEDESSIVMSSGQELEFQQASTGLTAVKSEGITSWKTEKWGRTPQILITSGRIVFNSSQQEIIAFAKNGIGLSSDSVIGIDSKNSISLDSKRINIGSNSTEPLVLGNQLVSLLQNILAVMAALDLFTVVPGTQTPTIQLLTNQLQSILSQTAYTKR